MAAKTKTKVRIKDPPKIEQAKAFLLRTASRLSLKQIPTISSLLHELGDEPWKEEYGAPDSKPDFALFQKLKSQILERLESEQKAIEHEALALDNLYLVEDFELESREFEGRLENKKLALLQTPWEQDSKQWAYLESSKQKAKTRAFQEHAAKEIFYKITRLNYPALLLRANTGDGKTYCLGRVLRWILDSNFMEGKTFAPWKILYVTKASIVEQTKEDLEKEFGINFIKDDILVTNYEQLRADLGDKLIWFKEEYVDGELKEFYEWKKFVHPFIIIWDECQALKNEDSLQTQLSFKVNTLPHPPIQIFSSASPFARISSARNFCVSTKKKIKTGLGERTLDAETWSYWAGSFVSEGKSIYDWDKAGMKRLLKEMSEYIVTFKNVYRKHKAINLVRSIDFPSIDSRKRYEAYFEEWLKKSQELKNKSYGSFLMLVELNKFREAAELERAPIFARLMWEATRKNLAPICACNFKGTIAKTIEILHKDYNVSRDEISIIWGGDASFVKADKIYTKEEIQKVYRDLAQGLEVSKKTISQITNQIKAQIHNVGDLPSELKLGVQNRQQRWREIKNFQEGRSIYCFFTFGAGGAGLSLHHKYEHTRQRFTLVAPTYNEMELYQALGRAPRLTSLSDTEQIVLLFKGTVEEQVLARVSAKTNVLQAVIQHGDVMTKQQAEILTTLSGASEEDEDKEGEEMYKEIEESKD